MRHPKILLVEDEQLLRMSLELNLRRHGIGVTTAQNGTEALSLLGQDSYKLLITDFLMEELTGSELLQQARRQLPNIKVIVISGYANEDLNDEILQSGADMFLWKPITMENLLMAIEKLLEI